jgi:peptidoglycan hydrolase CwlO-like protein
VTSRRVFVSLTIASIRTLWEKGFLPSIREEIKAEIDGMKREITSLTAKCNDIENSQKFLSSEYDSLKGSLQETKKGISEVSKTLKSLNDRVGISDRDLHETRETMDSLQQYLRRDCIEITGIPIPPKDDPKQIADSVSWSNARNSSV